MLKLFGSTMITYRHWQNVPQRWKAFDSVSVFIRGTTIYNQVYLWSVDISSSLQFLAGQLNQRDN